MRLSAHGEHLVTRLSVPSITVERIEDTRASQEARDRNQGGGSPALQGKGKGILQVQFKAWASQGYTVRLQLKKTK